MENNNSTYFSNISHQTSSYVFARHETFHIRYGWLTKGYLAFQKDKNIFHDENAPVNLGVGKNMVKSIKYWCNAFKLLSDSEGDLKVTDFANTLFKSDLYLQDKASLWLLHWNLLKKPCLATTWEYFFNHFNKQRFTVNELINGIKAYLSSRIKVAEKTINNDIHCLLRMYCKENGSDRNIEETINSPFTDLGLISEYEEKGLYTVNIGKKPGLTYEVILSVCLDYAHTVNKDTRSISISRLLNDKGSPGLIFKLTESTLYEAIEEMASKYPYINLSDTAGLIQLFYDGSPSDIANKILKDYYAK